MKSIEVYKEINSVIFPNFKSNGFKRVKSGMLGYYKQLKEFYLIIWFQCSSDGFDKYSGSKFIVEIQVSKTNEIGTDSIFRHRIPFFLAENDLAEIAITENQIKDNFQKPQKTHYIFSLEEDIQNWYKKKFKKSDNTYNKSSDIWFVYYDEKDVQKWANLIGPMINRIIHEFEEAEY